MKISVISPVYRAEKIVDELVRQIRTVLVDIGQPFEILLVEDGGPDNSWQKIEANCAQFEDVKGIKLSRNFGQHYAISCGLKEATGDVCIVMDCDLQDDPKYIVELLAKYQEGFDIVYTAKKKRKHSAFKNITASAFNRVFNWLVDNNDAKSSNSIGSYSLLSRKVVDAYNRFSDYRRHYLMVLRWLGFQSTEIIIEHKSRFEGKSSYTLSKLINHAIDGITTQSDKLLRLTVILGMVMSFISFIGGLGIIIQSLISPFKSGWASMFVLILFVGGLIILCIGISAIYIGKIFEQTKNRPLYLVDKRLNL